RPLPLGADLEQQKKQAKELLRAFESGDAEAQSRIRARLPDKPHLALADAQFVLAREYGFENWAALKQHIVARSDVTRSPQEQMHDAFQRRDAAAVRRLFERYPAFRQMINAPVLAFNSPPIVACANDEEMVKVLLEFGADPNKKSEWWAGGFHALYSATGAAAERLIAAGAIPDACAAAHLDRPDLLAWMIADDPTRVNERGGDGQTPLHFARSRDTVDLLLGAGADIDARDVDHRSTAAEWMLDHRRGAGRYDLARYLVERGASTDIFLATALGLTGRVRAMLRNDPALLDARIGRGIYAEQPPSSYHIYFWTIGDRRSPLDVATQFEQQETLEAMSAFASPLQLLHLACGRGDETGARSLVQRHSGLIASMTPDDHRAITDAAWKGDARSVALMLALGFDPRIAGHDSGTALHCAAWQGSTETVAALLRYRDARALLGLKDARYGATPLGWCCHGSRFGNTHHDHAGVARLLLDAGARPGDDTREASPPVEAVLARAERN
ncbi:MAG: ankyrin repeat domain-containing protein, partial [bacterium]